MKSIFNLTSKIRFRSIQALTIKTSPITIGVTTFATLKPQEETDEEKRFHSMVTEYYGQTLQTSDDLKTNACCTAGSPPLTIRNALKKVPDEICAKYYGCGSPLPFGIDGLTVLDLGSGSGRDCYVASQLVGEKGNVIGIDMTDEQLSVSRKYADSFCKDLGYKSTNMKYIKGFIEMLPQYIDPGSVDIVISNCVVNLSPRKDKVIEGVYNVLKEGGEFYFSDVYCDRRLSEEIKNHEVLVGECLGGALYIEDFRRICQKAGFEDPRVLKVDVITVNDPKLEAILGNAKFYSITYRLFKTANIEDKCEDFGQTAIYKGTIAEHPHYYDLDDHHRFFTNKPMLVCGNTASMIGETWLQSNFEVTGDTTTHYGLFDCAPVSATPAVADQSTGGCC